MIRKKNNNLLYITLILILLLPLLICSCVTSKAIKIESTDALPSIYQKYSERFNQIEINMSEESFKNIFPEAYLLGSGNEIKTYEFKDTQLYYTARDQDDALWETFFIETHEYVQKVWFDFKEGKLIKWGSQKK
jgi:hypothetical protein